MNTSKEQNNCKFAIKKLPTFSIKKNDLRPLKKSDFLRNTLYKEDLLYESQKGDFLKSDTQLKLVNRLNLITKSSVTVATYGASTLERTSDNVSRLIGQSNYDTVFSALCSVISHELKIRGILSLLTPPKKTRTWSSQTDDIKPSDDSKLTRQMVEKSCQTEESSIILTFDKDKRGKRTKRKQFNPYVVTESPVKKAEVKIIVHPKNFKESNPSIKMEKLDSTTVGTVMSPVEEDQVTAPVCASPQTFNWSVNTDLTLLDGTILRIPFKIEDEFHIATPEIMKFIPPQQRMNLLLYQAYVDWKNCLTPDEDHHLPIHVAAMNGDVSLLRRQCLVLQTRHESVDILSTKDNLTALQISIFSNKPECTELLLQHGADVLATDDEYRTSFHLAAEADPEHLKALIKHCQTNPMKILQDNEDIWKPELASKPKDYLCKYLLRKITTMFDNEGYTPLMLSSKLGKHHNVKLLIDACPETVNVQMPSSGNTALYLAIGSAYLDASNRGNKSTVSEDFKHTIEYLVELGADPAIENHSGSNVNTVLTDLRIGELSMIVANKMTSKNWMEADKGNDIANPFNVGMLLKDKDGKLKYREVPKKTTPKSTDKDEDAKVTPKEAPKKRTHIVKTIDKLEKRIKPTILQNIKILKDDPMIKKINPNELTPVKEIRNVKKDVLLTPSGSSSKKSLVIEVPHLKSVIVENKVPRDGYMETFKNFVANNGNDKIETPVAFTSEANSDAAKNVTLNEGDKADIAKTFDSKATVATVDEHKETHSSVYSNLKRKRSLEKSDNHIGKRRFSKKTNETTT
ncbi:unnamed protein product [Chilo suppressalis]|uniref:Uncharacterized protein n=1 Tax=Chilo suppressalis TaxID=168631 RepID=A0ABN8BAV3_CHISP|nr:unnamed protein product [Chilo suppressalis]